MIEVVIDGKKYKGRNISVFHNGKTRIGTGNMMHSFETLKEELI